MKHLIFTSLVLGAISGIWAMPTTGAFATPMGKDRENTGPLFWLHGTESKEQLESTAARVAESGQGILTAESRPHIDWMREGWWRDLKILLDACKKHGMKMMIFDDYWWPSQGMGGKYPIPEQFHGQDIFPKIYARGEAPAGKLPNEIVRVNAKETKKGEFVLGECGDKTIVYTWGRANPKTLKAGGGHFRAPLVNGLDEAAVDWFIANYYQPHYDHFKEDFHNGNIPGFFFDEPQMMSWWGPALDQELRARGEDLGELLTALKFKLADEEEQKRAVYRFQDARCEVWGRTMYGRQSDWCRKHGVYSSGHFLEHDWCYYDLGLAAGDVLKQLKYVEVPGVDLVCCQYYPHQRESKRHQIAFGQMPKYSSSVAHVYNRHNGLNWCEIFGAYFQRITYPQMKWMLDWHQSQGCYYLIPHSFNPRAPYDTDCPPYFYNGGKEPRYPLFRIWADYNNRCAMLLSEGEHVCRIAQCVPGISFHAGKTIRPEMFAFAIQDAQLDSDWMNYDAVETARFEKNPRTGRMALRTQNGKEHYDILTLPATEYVPFAVLEKALAFAQAGGVVVGYGIKPSNTPTRGKSAAAVQELVAKIFAQPTALFIEGEPNGEQLRAALAKNYPGTSAPLAVRELDFAGLSAADGRMLAMDQYEKNGDHVFFIANQDFARGRELMVKAAWPAAAAELWDPMQGTVEKPAVVDGCVKLSLAPSGAAFLVWPKTSTAGLLPRVEQPTGAALAATVKETVTPVAIEEGNAAFFDQMFKDAQWIWHPVDRSAQGKVTFRTCLEAKAAGEVQLVFACDNAATVKVNGKFVAAQAAGAATEYPGWRTPIKAKVALQAGRNSIEVVGDNVVPGPAGFIASFRSADGTRFLTDAKWEVTRDGKNFVKAAEVAKYGQGPWGGFGRRRVTSSPFAESVETTLAFTAPKLSCGERLYLVCDDVEGEHSAAVTVNGAFAGGFIGKPYRLDVTKAVKPGANTLVTKPFRMKNPRLIVVK